MRKITIDNSRDEKPRGMAWRRHYRRAFSGVLGSNYMVRIDANGLQYRVAYADNLTAARKIALREVRAGSAWAEIFQYAENGVSIKPVFMASYEVETESGGSLK